MVIFMDVKKTAARFDDAVKFLPSTLRGDTASLSAEVKAKAEEFRLRCGHEATVLTPEGEVKFSKQRVTRRELETVLELATNSSVHSAIESISSGYVTVAGGHRLGLCGSVVIKSSAVTNITKLSSLSLRIAKEFPGVADEAIEKLSQYQRLRGLLIISPPGGGKTTLLRDVIRQLSNGTAKLPAKRIGIVDERGELAAVSMGIPQLDIGTHTDVMDGCHKAAGIVMLTKSMNPQLIAVDEITSPDDIEALEQAANCGVGLIATAHAGDLQELRRRPLYRRLLELRIFDILITIEKSYKRSYNFEKLE